VPTDPQPLTLFDAVARAVAVCDQSGVDAGLGEFLARFEDADEPIGTAAVARDRIYEELGALDPQEEDGALQLAAAVAVYLCFRRDHADHPPAQLIRQAVAAEFSDDTPETVTLYLQQSGLLG
jgi:hypothetical protein